MIRYHNREWLYKEYITNNRKKSEIARDCNVSETTIKSWLNRMRIIKRNKDELYMDKDWLYQQHVELKKPICDISKEFNISYHKLWYWVQKLNIKKTNLRKGYKKGENNHRWKGGKFETKKKKFIYYPEHHRASTSGYVLEHILIAEQTLARPLKYYGNNNPNNEIVHHIDTDSLNNEPDNLYICKDRQKHRATHINLSQIATELYKKGFVGFNNKKGEYYIKDGKI